MRYFVGTTLALLLVLGSFAYRGVNPHARIDLEPKNEVSETKPNTEVSFECCKVTKMRIRRGTHSGFVEANLYALCPRRSDTVRFINISLENSTSFWDAFKNEKSITFHNVRQWEEWVYGPVGKKCNPSCGTIQTHYDTKLADIKVCDEQGEASRQNQVEHLPKQNDWKRTFTTQADTTFRNCNISEIVSKSDSVFLSFSCRGENKTKEVRFIVNAEEFSQMLSFWDVLGGYKAIQILNAKRYEYQGQTYYYTKPENIF